MKKMLLLFTLLFAISASAINTNADGTYLISSAEDLCEFSSLVNGGRRNINALLTNNISMKGYDYTPIGTNTMSYCGTFDGQGFTIDSLTLSLSSNGVGIFGYIDSAHILNLTAGTANNIKGKAFVGGFVGDKIGNGTARIERCGHEGKVTGSAENAAAFVGCVHNGSLAISYCYNSGRVSGNRESAIFCGWMGGSNSSISYCYNSGTLTAGAEGSNYLYRSLPTITNVYDSSGRQNTIRFTLAQRKNGALAWMLNGNTPDGPFRQNIDNEQAADDHPVLKPLHGIVYASGTLKCDGTPASSTPVYSNNNNATYLPHDFAHGLCNVCSLVDMEYMYTNYEGYYEIATPEALCWFAYMVNTIPGHTADFCRITEDINMTGYNFPGIGTNDAPFCGEIDGRKNIISGLTMKRTGETCVGLVNVGTDGLEVHDLTLDASCTFTGYRYVGGFAGKVSGENGGNVYFSNLGFEGTVNVNDNGGGIIGCVPNNDFTAHFTNCYTIGTINGVNDNGALSGWSSYARIRNCYVLVKGKGWENGHDICRGFTPRFTNSYACGAVQTGSGLGTFTEKEMQDGTLLKKLWPNVYHQEIGTDTHPLLSHPRNKTPEDQPNNILPLNGTWIDGNWFDLNGRAVTSKMPCGIYIRNGKKVFIK